MNSLNFSMLLNKLSLSLEEFSPEQFNDVMTGKLKLKVSLVPNRENHSSIISEVNVDSYIEELKKFPDRPSAEIFLSTLKKNELQALAKKYDLSVDGSIAKDKLVLKLVERAVGLKLRQEAFSQIR
jgi:hypothetical protein